MSTSSYRVLVGVDGSPDGREAVYWAAETARLHEGSVALLYASELLPTSVLGPALFSSTAPRHVQRSEFDVLTEAADRIREHSPEVDVTTQNVFEDPTQALIDASLDADLVVLRPHDCSRIERVLLGSVTQQLVGRTRAPVAAVRGTPSAGAPVLLAVDGSRASSRAISFAVKEAALRCVPLVALHVWREPTYRELGAYAGLDLKEEDLEHEAFALLTKELTEVSASEPDVEIGLRLRRGRPEEVLAEEMRDAQFIVLGSHGRTGISRILLGSVARSLLRGATGTVVIVPPFPSQRS